MSARNSLIVLFLLCSAILAKAQQEPAAPDFSAGFKQLAALGMPALDDKATWSTIPEAANSDYETRDFLKSVKGNAWLLPAAEDKPRAIALGGVEVIELKSAKKRPAGLDLTKDTEAIIAALKKLATKNAEVHDPFGGSSSLYRSNSFGCFLLFATQLYQTGHPALANQLAMAVFELFPSRETAVDSAIDLLADHFYQEATRAFFTSGDWAAYHKALADLTKRFPRGWAAHDAVGMFLPQLEKQATGTKAPAPTLPDIAIDPRATAIIREFTEKPPADPDKKDAKDQKSAALSAAMRYNRMRFEGYYEGEDYGPSQLWLINDEPDGQNPDAAAKGSPLTRLAALKMAAIPALAALTSDPFLTHQPNNSSYSSRYFSSSDNEEDRALEIYGSLNRPATRGEIALRLLTATLPEGSDDGRQPDPETLRETALAFWKDHKDATREELAAVFLREGSNNQSTLASSILAASTDPKAHQAFEAHVLAADPAIAKFQDVQTYLRARKAAARPFFDAYAKLVRSQSSDGDLDNSNQYAWAVKQAGGAEKILKQLEGLVGGQSPRALAVQIAKGKPAAAKAAIRSLSSLLTDATPVKHLHALLEGANAATDATVRARFLTATLSIRWRTGPSDEGQADEEPSDEEKGDEEPKEAKPPPDRKVSEPEAVVWRKLVADTRELPAEFTHYGKGDKCTVSELAAIAFENSVSSLNGNDYSAYTASIILNKSIAEILAERGAARLAGKPIPPLPDASKISKDRLTEIVATAGGKPAAEIHPYLSALTPDERAAWFEWFNEPDDPAVPDSVRELEFTIVGRDARKRTGTPDVNGAGNLDVGFKITPDSLTKYIESLAPEIDKHSRTVISINPAAFGPGLEVLASVIPLPSKTPKRVPNSDESDESEYDGDIIDYGSRASYSDIKTLDANEDASAIARISMSGSEISGCQSTWLIQDGKATLETSEADDDDGKDPVANAIKQLLESKEPQRFSIQIQLLSRADAEKFKAAERNPDTPPDESPPTEDD